MRLRSVKAWKLHTAPSTRPDLLFSGATFHQHRDARPVWLLDDDLGTQDRLAGAEHAGDWRCRKGQGGAVGLIAPEAGNHVAD